MYLEDDFGEGSCEEFGVKIIFKNYLSRYDELSVRYVEFEVMVRKVSWNRKFLENYKEFDERLGLEINICERI